MTAAGPIVRGGGRVYARTQPSGPLFATALLSGDPPSVMYRRRPDKSSGHATMPRQRALHVYYITATTTTTSTGINNNNLLLYARCVNKTLCRTRISGGARAETDGRRAANNNSVCSVRAYVHTYNTRVVISLGRESSIVPGEAAEGSSFDVF